MSNQLRDAVHRFQIAFERIEADEQALVALKDDLVQRLQHFSAPSGARKDRSAVDEVATRIKSETSRAVTSWAESWQAREGSRRVSEKLEDRVIFLVFGKVNAGKSSFCNFVASLFPSRERAYFVVQGGDIHPGEGPFQEGTTETTNQIQGVELANKLVLLDSPGLHSVTEENGALTQLYTDSADAVIWLTASTSPGQVQELDNLREELETRKPLLPIITRSDYFEEDVDASENIVTVRRNKSAENRALQQNDVMGRAREKIGESGEVRAPLSVSVLMYQESSRSRQDLEDSGLAQALTEMVALTDRAAESKPYKARRAILRHLNEQVSRSLQEELLPLLDEFDEKVHDEREGLERQKTEVAESLNLELAERVTDWAEELSERRDSKELAHRITSYIQERIGDELHKSMLRFADRVDEVLLEISSAELGEYEDRTVEVERVTGQGRRAATGGVGGVVGATVGAIVGGPIGGVIGGIIGGAAGDAAGDYLVTTETVKKTIGVDASGVIDTTLATLQKKVPAVVDAAFSPWERHLSEMMTFSADLRVEIRWFEEQLEKEKEQF